MEQKKIKVGILPSQFLKEDGSFDKIEAIKLSGKIAGICYDKEGFSHLENEPLERTMHRIDMTLNNGHHSVYDHITIHFNFQNIPKILAMVLNNEHYYTASEKSMRYTPISTASSITKEEINLYEKWFTILKEKIKSQYGSIYSASKIAKLAQENARYFVTVFMPTQMIYSTSLRQINSLASWMRDYIETCDKRSTFKEKLALSMQEVLQKLQDRNVLEEGLLKNEKQRKLSLFGKDLDRKEEYFGEVYSTGYKASLAYLAQAQRHRTLDYQMEFLTEKEYFIPPILMDEQILVDEWLEDMRKVSHVHPQGELVRIREIGKYDDFILKCKERLCSASQLEMMLKTKDTLSKYEEALEVSENPLARDIEKYMYGARCTFPDFACKEDCHFKEGKTLVRKI